MFRAAVDNNANNESAKNTTTVLPATSSSAAELNEPTIVTVEVYDDQGCKKAVHNFQLGEEVVFSVDTPTVEISTESSIHKEQHQNEPLVPTSSSFWDLAPIPHDNRSLTGNEKRRKRTAAHATVLTSTPYKDSLQLSRPTKKSTPSVAEKKRQGAKRQLKFKSHSTENNNEVTAGKINRKPSCNKKQMEEMVGIIRGHKTSKETTTKQNKTKGTNKTSEATKNEDKDEASCLYCGELWSQTKGNWIKCQGPCCKWAHAACAGVESKTIHFMCELCRD